jgi:amidase
VAGLGPLLRTDRELLKADIVWNVEQGLAVTTERLGWAERVRGGVQQAMARFLERYDLLLCPTSCVAPFEVETRWVREVDGVAFDNYVDWLRITSSITLSGCPVVALPCGLTVGGLPVGMQLVGRPHGDWELVAAAAGTEQVLGMAHRVPLLPDGAVV